MKMDPSDLEIEVLVRRIASAELDLQPDFQRGEVWSEKKRQRLIDSVLRGWHIPPIHVIEIAGTGKEEVLDGQQRLAAIRDFVGGVFRIDGRLPPFDKNIEALDGLSFAELPSDLQRRFNRFAIRQFRLTDYSAEEPAEIFFRLNQPTSLTTAEQRNAFVGRARAQVKELVAQAATAGIDEKTIGFSNSRMAYDDVFARICLASERRSIRRKITAGDLTTYYREADGFSAEAVTRVLGAIRQLAEALRAVDTPQRLNKATLFSWLWFLLASMEWRVDVGSAIDVGTILRVVESIRPYARAGIGENELAASANILGLLSVYDDRATSRVADVSSVVARDVVLWTIASMSIPQQDTLNDARRWSALVSLGRRVGQEPGSANDAVDEFLRETQWGDL